MEEPSGNETPSMPAVRHDGWTGEKIAIFCETLAETAVVAEACEEARMSVAGAYAARRRNPLFAAAWDAALTIARDRLADTLLARSMEGNVEQIYRDGELVGERHVLDNRLGLAILRRLDRIAESGAAVSMRGVPHRALAPAPQPGARLFDWAGAVHALRSGDDAGVARALSLTQGNEVEEVEGPPVSLIGGEDAGAGIDLSDRCWRDDLMDGWMTDFPPPDGFDGFQSRDYDDVGSQQPYHRTCTADEAAILDADAAVALSAERAEDEDLRDRWFALLRGDDPDGDEADGERAPGIAA